MTADLPPLTTSTPPQGAVRGLTYSIAAVWHRRELLGMLVRRDVAARFSNSVLGALWVLARPLALLAVYVVAIGTFLGAERLIPSFALFVFTGLTAWTFFTEAVGGSTTAVIGNAALVKKVYLPRELFSLSVIGSSAVTAGVQLIVLLVATAAFGQFPLHSDLALLPLSALALLALVTALALLLSALTVSYRDLQHLVEVGLLIGFWLSPIVYSYRLVADEVGGTWLEQLYLANPMTIIAMGFQKALWIAGADQPWPPDLELRILAVLVLGVLGTWAAQRIFARREGDFAQEL
ncbi:MAG: ABC transporter permease [Microcella pacifica]|uniref:ABC transporter permease n=1 Tax=Microcella pacifica TaxID=2591847 RepID=UPI0033146DBE